MNDQSPSNRRGANVRQAAAAKQAGTDLAQREEATLAQFGHIRETLLKERAWYDSVSPSHVNATQHIALCWGLVKNGDWQLQRALVETPHSFFEAATECAQLGLVPGKTYHFVAFRNKVKGTQNDYMYAITGIVDYKGEIDMIYRAGGVRSVCCDVVRANDVFRWRRGMELPYHVVSAPSYAQSQEGLAGPEERGILTGVYAYAVMLDGGYSDPVVMGKETVLKYRAVSKTDAFWGPEWPLEGPWTEDMWKKTAIHKLFDRVPHSVEYAQNLLRAHAETVQRGPASRDLPVAPPEHLRELTAADDERPATRGEASGRETPASPSYGPEVPAGISE